MAIKVIDTLEPKSNFPVVDAENVGVDGARLPAALESKADNTDIDNLQAQINQIVIESAAESIVAPEVAQARVGADGTEYDTLKERLDAENEAVSDNITEIKNDIKDMQNGINTVDCGTWEIGYINMTTGEDSENAKFARTVGYIPMEADKIYTSNQYVVSATGQTPECVAYFYDENHSLISTTSVKGSTFKADGSLMRLVYFYTGTPVNVVLSDAELTKLMWGDTIEPNQDIVSLKSTLFETGIKVNKCKWEHGLINLSTGVDNTEKSRKYARTIGYISRPTEDYIQFSISATGQTPKLTILFYNENKVFVSQKAVNGQRIKIDYPYFRLVYFYNGTQTDVDIKDAKATTFSYIPVMHDSQRENLEKAMFEDGAYIFSDMEWELGLISQTTGEDTPHTKFARTKGFFKTPTNLPITFTASVIEETEQTPKLTIYYYNEEKEYISSPDVTNKTVTITAPYFRLVYFYEDTPADVNLDDAGSTRYSYVPDFKLPVSVAIEANQNVERLDKCLFEDGELRFNLDWELGLIDQTTGEDLTRTKFARNRGFIKTPTDLQITFNANTAVHTEQTPKLTIYYYDEDFEYVSSANVTDMTITVEYPYFRLVYFYEDIPIDVDLEDARSSYYSYVPEFKLPIHIEQVYSRNKYIAFGDSITWGHLSGGGTGTGRASNPYPTVVGRSLGLEVTYGAQTGSGWVHPSGDKTAVTIIDSTDCSLYNLATIAFGTNDWYGNIPLGTLSDTETTTIYGAMKHCIEKILDDNPSICLIIITPINAKNLNAIDGAKTNQGNYRYDTPNTQGVTLNDICEAEVAVAEYYGLPCIDNSKGSIVNRINTADGSIFIDTLHPTDDFYKTLGQWYSGRIGQYFRPYSV